MLLYFTLKSGRKKIFLDVLQHKFVTETQKNGLTKKFWQDTWKVFGSIPSSKVGIKKKGFISS